MKSAKKTESAGWTVMARMYPGSLPVPCKDGSGRPIVLESEEAAVALARKYRSTVSGSCPGGGPHYFAQAVGS